MIVLSQEPETVRFCTLFQQHIWADYLFIYFLHFTQFIFNHPFRSFSSRLSSSDVALILGNLEEISTFQQMLVQSLEECTKLVPPRRHTQPHCSSILTVS